MSVDLLPSDSDFGPHYQGDVRDVLGDGWDLGIFHPPCTYLANSSVRWLWLDRSINKPDPMRWANMVEGAEFFRELFLADLPRIAVENPIMHKHARNVTRLGPADQYVQPWMFGEGETKATGLWLKNLPNLVPTNIVEGRHQAVHLMSPGPDRWKKRSITYQGIADAMAAQWGNLAPVTN